MLGEIMCQTEPGFSQAGAYHRVWELLNDKVARQVAGAHVSLGAKRKSQEETSNALLQDLCLLLSSACRQHMLALANVSYEEK